MFIALIGASALIQTTQVSPPASAARWSLQVEPARCVLERRNSEGGQAFAIDTTPGSDSYRVAIATDATSSSASFEPASLTFSPSQKEEKGFGRTVALSNGAGVVTMQGLPPVILDDLAGSSTVEIDVKKGARARAAVPGSAKAVDALRTCISEQLVEWGADPSQFAPRGMVPTAAKDRDLWIPDRELLRIVGQSKRDSIDDAFRLLVANDGTIAECHATSDVTEPGLEKSVCSAVLKKRLFTPARNPSGDAVLGVATFKVSLMRRPS